MLRLEKYYQLFPGKTPDVVFFDRDYIEYIPAFEAHGYQLTDEETSEYAYIMRRKVY